MPSLSLATVYKNLETLRALGAVGDVLPQHSRGRYEAVLPGTGADLDHHHLVCTGCHKILDLPAALVPAPVVGPEAAMGFEVRAVRVQVEGLCGGCRARR
jgi:Fur family ferric uptake transcriptional regulator